MARLARSVAYAMLLLVAVMSSCVNTVAVASPPNSIFFYMHINGDNDVRIVNSSNPRFGGLTAFDLPITAGVNATSESLGFVRGLGIVFNGSFSSTPTLEQLFNTIYYDDGVYEGTISQHGLIDSSFSGGPTELAVVGGTGDFRRVQGYSVAAFVSSSPVALTWNVSLFFPQY